MFPEDKADRWHKIFFKLKKLAQKESVEREKALASTMQGLRDERASNTAEVSNRKPIAAGKGKWTNSTFNINAVLYGSSKGKDGAEFFSAMRRGMQGAKLRNQRLNMASAVRPNNGVVKKAPAFLVNELKQKTEFQKKDAENTKLWKEQLEKSKTVYGPSMIRPPRSGFGAQQKSQPNAAMHAPGGQSYDPSTDREARLRALKNGTKLEPSQSTQPETEEPNQLTLDFLESDEDDDLFGDEQPEGHHNEAGSSGEPITHEIDDDDLFGDNPPRAKSHSPPQRSLRAPVATPSQISSSLKPHIPSRGRTASPAPNIFAKNRPSPRPAALAKQEVSSSTMQRPASTTRQTKPVTVQSLPPKPKFYVPDGGESNVKKPLKMGTGQKRKAAEPLAKILSKRRR